MKLTQEQKEKYLKSPNHCPVCNSDQIIADYFVSDDFDGNSVTQEVKCDECAAEWRDVYALTSVEDV
jgi:C4-type Zn-finger protein